MKRVPRYAFHAKRQNLYLYVHVHVISLACRCVWMVAGCERHTTIGDCENANTTDFDVVLQFATAELKRKAHHSKIFFRGFNFMHHVCQIRSEAFANERIDFCHSISSNKKQIRCAQTDRKKNNGQLSLGL